MILQHIVLTNDTYTSKYTTIVQLNKIFYDNIFCINFSKKLDLYAVNAFLTSTS